MALQPVYLVSVGNLGKFLEALRHAQAPDKFSLRFIEELGFKSTNDRLFLPLLKAMRFLDEAGKPTSRYHSFLDDNEWKNILAAGIRDAYPDIFRVNREANSLTKEQLSGKIKSLGEGKISPAILTNTVRTFLELVKLANFSQSQDIIPTPEEQEGEIEEGKRPPQNPSTLEPEKINAETKPTLVFRIEIVLPTVRDQAVYDAIFKSAKEHLLK